MSSNDSNPKEIKALLRFARAYCAEQLPWFSPALFRCKIHLSEQIVVAAIDYHFNIYFNPKAIATIDISSSNRMDALSQIGFLWIHEISHVLRDHSTRAKELNAAAESWNIAADLEINDGQWSGLKMPEAFPGLHPRKYGLPTGQLSEYYYKWLKKHADRIDRSIDEGSGVHGKIRPWELEQKDEVQQLGVTEIDLVRKSVAQAISEANIGTIPGSWKKWAIKVIRSKVDWRKKLSHRLKRSIAIGLGQKLDYSFRRPNRRQAVYYTILAPTLSGKLQANIACVVDTSGSMQAVHLNQALAEIKAILQAFNSPITIIPCDTRAHKASQISFEQELFSLKKLPGGGGTDMRVGIDAAMQLDPLPDTILVLTDGYTPYPMQVYSIPIIFALLGKAAPIPPNPPWRADTYVHIELI